MRNLSRVLFLIFALTTLARAQQSQVEVLSPAWTVVNYPDFTLDVVGGGFVSGAQVLWNSVPLATTFVNSSELQAQVPSANLLQPGAIPISVENADGTLSGSQNFTIRRSNAQVDRVIPQAFPPTLGVALTIYGQNFISGSHVVVDGYDEGQGAFVSPTQINVSLGNVSHLAGGYAHQVRVTYPPVANPYGSLTPDTHTTSPITATISPAAVAFGNQNVLTTSASAKVFSLAAGASPMSIGSISISGSSTFVESNNCPATLNPGQYCTIDVKFAPTSATSFAATVTAIDNAQNSPQTAALSGTGVTPGSPPPSSPAVQLSPSGLTFGEVPVSTTSGAMTSVLTNTGTATLTFTSIVVTGTNAADFTLATGGSNCPSSGTLAASASCNLSVTFNTSTAQAESASITITDNAGDSPESVPMTATGYVPSGSSGCSVAKPTSLLCGQTAEHFSIPPGWTLVQAEGFDSGSFAANEVVPASSVTPSITNSLAHTGTSSLIGEYTGNDDADGIYFNPSGPGAGLSSFHSIYISYWERTDSNALFNQGDYIEAALVEPSGGACGGAPGIGTGGQSEPSTGASFTVGTIVAFGTGNPGSGCPNADAYNNAANLAMDAGRWEQHEFLITPSTSFGSPDANPLPNCNNLTPTTPGCGNGTLQFFVNGNLIQNLQNANLNYSTSFNGATVLVGGYVTSWNVGLTMQCLVWSFTGGGTCPGSQPGTGAPQPFHRYFDDIIIMKQ